MIFNFVFNMVLWGVVTTFVLFLSRWLCPCKLNTNAVWVKTKALSPFCQRIEPWAFFLCCLYIVIVLFG